MWLPFALFSAIFIAGKRVYEKKLTSHFGNFTMGFITQAFSLIPTLVLFFFLPIPNDIWHLPWQFWWPLIIIWFILYPIQTYFLYHSIRKGEISQVTPIMAVLPALNTISSFLIIGERPSISGILGIIAIVFATYLLLAKDKKVSGERYNKVVLYMIFANICIAIGTTLDKISIKASTPVFYSFMNTLGASVVFLILMHIYKQKNELKTVKKMFGPLTLLGILQALSYTAIMIAFSLGPTSYTLAVRSSGYLFAGILGVFLLKEKFTRRKVYSLILFGIGIILITVVK